MHKTSHALFLEAQKSIPGGVNSPVRAFKGVGGDPVFVKRAAGAYLYDVDDHKYIDYVGSWGPMILGHAEPQVVKSVQDAAANGLSYGAPTALETKMAEKVKSLIPSIDMVRMVSSGTEATMSAIRLARGFTGRDKIIKFEGCYHGHADSLLIKAGSGALTLGVPTSPGVPAALAQYTLTLNYNDTEQIDKVLSKIGGEVACIIVEPVAGNMSCIPPAPGFLEALRSGCDKYGIVLIFDEVMTGFRVALGGAQSHYQVQPDLTTLGKIIGGGMPVGAFGGKQKIMEFLAPLGSVYQAGTLSGNPLAMTAGLKTLTLISKPGFYEKLSTKTKNLTQGIIEVAAQNNIAMQENHVGGMFGLFFTEQEKITNFAEVSQCDAGRFAKFFHGMLEQSIYLAPSAFEAGFVSAAHTDADIENTIKAANIVLSNL